MIDCHSHLYPDWYLDLLRRRDVAPRIVAWGGREYFQAFDTEGEQPGNGSKPPGQPISPEFWELGDKLTFMDRHDIDFSIVSAGNPWAEIFLVERSVADVARLNEELAALAMQSGHRVLPLGVLPHDSPQSCLDTVSELAAERSFVGVISGPTLCGRQLDDPALFEVWERLAAARLTLFIHPSRGCGAVELFRGFAHVLPLAAGFLVESATAAIRLALSGVLERTGLRVLLAHAGGILPVIRDRLEAVAGVASTEISPATALSNVYVDSVAAGEAAWQAAMLTFGHDHIVFGSDHPFLVGGQPALEANRSRVLRDSIATESVAQRAFPRLVDVLAQA